MEWQDSKDLIFFFIILQKPRYLGGLALPNFLFYLHKTKELIVDFRKRQQQPLHSSYDQWDPCGEGEQLQVPRCKHLRGLGLHTFKHRLRKPGKDCTIYDS